MISFNNSIIDVVCLPLRGNYVTQYMDGHVARVHRGIDAKASIPTGKAKPALASQEPALTSRNGFPGGGRKERESFLYPRKIILPLMGLWVCDYCFVFFFR